MQKEERQRVRRDLDNDIRIFRSRKIRRTPWGWLRGVRQALGMQAGEIARRMKIGESEVFRLEVAEQQESITLRKLREAAAAMGCELVYAVVPVRGSLEDLAEEIEEERRKRLANRKKRGPRDDPYGLAKTVKAVLTLAGWDIGK
jgi:predicted DNA-binding mobile mystery protein A